MKYTIYKTTNKVNGMFYIGAHATKDPYDDYLGSGVYLKRAIEAYGKDSFEKEVLFVFDTAEEMFEKEVMLIDHKDPNTYNLKEGGIGGWASIHEKHKDDPSFYSRPHTEETKKLISKKARNRPKRKLTEEDKRNKSIARKKWVAKNPDFAKGENNPAYGCIWITNGSTNQRIKKGTSIPEGWSKGMCHK